MNHLIDCQDARGTRYVLQYTHDEMAEVFTEAERATLAAGDVLMRDGSRYADLQAFYDARN